MLSESPESCWSPGGFWGAMECSRSARALAAALGMIWTGFRASEAPWPATALVCQRASGRILECCWRSGNRCYVYWIDISWKPVRHSWMAQLGQVKTKLRSFRNLMAQETLISSPRLETGLRVQVSAWVLRRFVASDKRIYNPEDLETIGDHRP